MIRKQLLKYQATVCEVHPLLSWKLCKKCNNEFRREIGWKITYEPDNVFYLCKGCSLTQQSVKKFCDRIGVVIKEFIV